MDIETLLISSINYYSEDHKPLFQHLIKCTNQIRLSSQDNHLPLLILKQKEIYLWIKDEGVSDFPFLFTDPEEILFILYQFLSTGETIFISKDIPIEFSKEQIQFKIENCLLQDDQEGFKYWVKLLKNTH